MRALWLVPALATSLLTSGAWAQSAQKGVSTATEPSTAAPVPAVAPGVPGSAGPAAIPEQVAPPSLTAGPANGTPFSGTPSGQLPSDTATPTARDQMGGSGAATPNLSR